MKNLKTMAKNKTSATIALLLISTFAISLLAIPLANAQHNPGWNMPTFAFITASPNPVGVGQKVDVLIWLDKPRASAALSNAYRMHKYNLTIIDSTGAVVLSQFWDTVVDTTYSQYYAWTPTVVGEYTLIFTFPGFYAGDYPSAPSESNDTYLPSSASTNLTVQQEPIPQPISSYPLPQEYWTRPIYGENNDWWSITSDWLGTGSPPLTGWGFSQAGIYRDPGYGVGPETGHVVWTQSVQSGGVAGGNNYPIQGNTYFEGSAYSQRYQNPIIVAGMLIYNPPISFTGVSSGPTTCVDLRTGKIIWQRADVPPISFAYVYDVEDPQQHGVYPPLLFTNNFAQGFDAYTGEPIVNVTGVPSGTAVLGPQGEHLRYVFANAGNASKPDWRLLQWNSSKLWTGAGWSNPTSSGLSPAWDTRTITTWSLQNTTTWINGVPTVTSVNVTTTTTNVYGGNGTTDTHSRYDWNITVPWRNSMPNTGSFAPTVVAASYNDVLLIRNGTLPGLTPAGFGTTSQTPYSYFAVNLNASRGTVGSVLWTKTYNPPPNNITVVGGIVDFNSRVFTETYKETRQHVGYSLETGERLWTTESQVPLDYYGNPSIPWVASLSAYGNLYSSAYGGIIYCYDLKTGELKWTYGNDGSGNSTKSGTGLGNYPTFIGAIGSGIIYAFTAEHTVTTPIYKGALARAINATTGEEIWTLSDYDGSFFAISYAIGDGFATFFNGYDNRIYVVGKGPSAMTVDAPKAGVTLGGSIAITGKVADISAGTTGDEQNARFPNGVPAVSDASMTDWMGYVYQQRPRPTNTIGVEVVLSVLDANNNFREIGRTTTDASGFYNFQWTPDITGKYTVVASFAGTKAYWPSSAEAGFVVDPVVETPTVEIPPDNSGTYIMYAAIAIIIAMIVIGAIIILALRRK